MGSLPFNQTPVEPQLKDVLDMLKKDIFLSLFCHAIGTVQEFDSTRQTASVSINYKKTYYQLNAATGLYDAVLVDYPVLVDCPVISLGGGAAALTFPVQQGDECLVLFNDRDMDNWFQGGSGTAVATPRLHSFADGIILVGLRSLGNKLDSYDMERARLYYGDTMVGVGESLVKIANAQYTLNELLQELVDDAKALITNVNTLVTATAAITVTCALPGQPSSVPVNAAAIAAVAAALTATTAQFTATAAKIEGLLE